MYCVLYVLKVVYEFYINVRLKKKKEGELQKTLAAHEGKLGPNERGLHFCAMLFLYNHNP